MDILNWVLFLSLLIILMIRYLLLLLVVTTILGQNPQPYPYCNALPSLNDVPITQGQTEVVNMDDLFRGFNLNLRLSDGAPDYVTLRDKFAQKADLKLNQTGLRSYHIDNIDNGWGTTFITLTENEKGSTIRWGRLASADTVPEIQGTLVVENEENVVCFDAILFMEQNLAMVDCALRLGLNNSHSYTNRFYYVDIVKQVVFPGYIKNEIFVPFQMIRQRRFYKLTDNGYHYLIRVYFAEGVDEKNRDNTYVEIYSANDPRKPYILKIMDRSLLGLNRLAITDFKLYMGDMYMLDYHQGLTKFDITAAQQIVIAGRYRTDSGFMKFGVYSSNLDNQFLLVLANRHAIYEVDWTDQIRPAITAKYSILADSWVNSISVNHKYVVVQSEGNVTRKQGTTSIYNMTWVFTRQSRLYTNAYALIPHDSAHTLIDFHRDLSHILSIDQQSITMYAINTPYLFILPKVSDKVGKEQQFNVIARSTNPVTNQGTECIFTFKVLIVEPGDYRIWPTGLTPSKEYYSNYPGELFIPLYFYAFGPNITWGVDETSVSGELPAYWTYQQNSTRLNWDKYPGSNGDIVFLSQQQYDSIEETDIYVYTQNTKNELYAAECRTEQFKVNVNCSIVFVKDSPAPILNLTANRFHYYNGRYLHLMAIIYQNDPNTIFIENVMNGMNLYKLKVADGFAGTITSLDFIGPYLIAVLRFAKTIVYWDLNRCVDYYDRACKQTLLVNADIAKDMGINYFSPHSVIASVFHPNTLFVQCIDSVLIFDFARNGPLLLSKISSAATQVSGIFGWQFAVSQGHLVIANSPNIIEEWSLEELTSKNTYLKRNYPLYDYMLPANFDLDFSDAGNLIYLTAVDKITNNGVVLVYKAGLPSVASFYDVFQMNSKFDNVIVEVTGTFADYVTLVKKSATGTTIEMFRQYEIPILVFEDTFFDFDFNLTYTNSKQGDKKQLSRSTVKIANYPTDIKINNPNLTNPNFLNSLLNYKNDQQKYVINDHQWFNGTVLNHSISCESECGRDKKIQLIDHVYDAKDVIASLGMWDIQISYFTEEIGIQQARSIIKMRHNGSISNYINMPLAFEGFGQTCQKLTYEQFVDFYVSGCVNDNEVSLYLTSEIGHKAFVMGPQLSSAKALDRLIINDKLLFLADIDQDPQYLQRPGSIIVYSLNSQPGENQMFDELEVLDSNDFTAVKEWTEEEAYLGGISTTYYPEVNLHRLFVTELRYGFFILDFTWVVGRTEINIVKVNLVNLRDILSKQSLPLPNQATIQAIAILSQSYDPKAQNWNVDVVVSVRNFHQFHLTMMIDRTSTVLFCQLKGVYYRYSFYESNTYLKAFDGYFVNYQRLPDVYDGYNMYTPQILAVYDTRPNRTEYTQEYTASGIPAYNMMGALPFQDKAHIAFTFNWTLRRNQSDPFSKIGLVAVDPSGRRVREIALSESLHIVTHPGISTTQHVKLTADNDYSHIQLPLTINIKPHKSSLPGWAIALIVIGSVAVAGGIGFAAWFFWKKKQEESEIKQSLLEEEAKKDQPEQQEGQQQGQEGQEGEEGEQQQGQQGQQGQQEGLQQKPDQPKASTQASEQKPEESKMDPVNREGAVNESVAASEQQD